MTGQRLHSSQRFELVMNEVRANGSVTVPGIAKKCNASEMTIRRDLDRLEEKGLLVRTHGGATLPGSFTGVGIDFVEPSLDDRSQKNHTAKVAIAQHAFAQIEPAQTVAIDIGSTSYELAKLIVDVPLSVFTTSLKIASHLSEKRPRVYVPGGEIHGTEPSIVGTRAVEDLSRMFFDIAFIGVSGMSTNEFYDYSLEDAEIKKAIIRHSRKKVVLLDSSKFGRMSVALVSGFSEIDVLITDRRPPDPLNEALETAGVAVEVALPVMSEFAG